MKTRSWIFYTPLLALFLLGIQVTQAATTTNTNLVILTNLTVNSNATMTVLGAATFSNAVTIAGSGTNLLISGSANITNNLFVGGTAQAGIVNATNNIAYGMTTNGFLAVYLTYTTNTKTAGTFAVTPSSSFLWQDNGGTNNKMLLDGSNNLTLYTTSGSGGITLKPNTGGIALTGTGSGITFADATVLTSTNSLRSTGIFNTTNSGGTQLLSADANGTNLDISAPIKLGAGTTNFVVQASAYITNTISYGTTTNGTTNLAAVLLSYTETNHTAGFVSTQPSSSFKWQDNGISGTNKNKLLLDGSNNLTLYATNGSNGITFNPNSGGIALAGTGAGISLLDGTVLSNAASLHSTGLYNASGTQVVSVTNGNVQIAAPIVLSGTGAGINFGSGNTLNPNNVAFLSQTLTNLGYRPTAAPADASLSLPNNFNVLHVVLDAAGNSYITGSFSGSGNVGGTTLTSSGNYDVFVMKVNSSGVVQWATNFGGGNATDWSGGIAVDTNGNTYVTGGYDAPITNGLNQTLGTNGGADVFVVQYNSSGVAQWSAGFGGGNDWSAGIGVDGNGNAYVVGGYGSSITTGLNQTLSMAGGADEFVVQFNSYGTVQWSVGFGGGVDWPAGMTVDASGNTYVTGGYSASMSTGLPQTLSTNGGADEFVVKLNSSGTVQWATGFGAGNDMPVGIAVDGSGNTYVAGGYSASMSTGLPQTLSTNGGADEFVVKFNTSGTAQWATGFGGGNGLVQNIAVDGSGNAFVTGQNNGTMSAGLPQPLAALNPSGGDLFVVQLNPTNGVVQWGGDFGTTGGWAYSEAIALNTNGSLALLGWGEGSFDMGNQVVSLSVGSFVYLGSESSLEASTSEATPSFSWGGSKASGTGAVALGTYASATSQGAIALGSGLSSGNYSFSAGFNTKASGRDSTAFGYQSIASGNYSTAFGNSSATGSSSTAFGSSSTASGMNSTAFGLGTKAASYNSIAIGQYNVGMVGSSNGLSGVGNWIASDPVLEVGDGNYLHASNAVTIFKSGKVRIQGTVEVKTGVRVPPQGDLGMGSYTNGANPATLNPGAGLLYPSGN